VRGAGRADQFAGSLIHSCRGSTGGGISPLTETRVQPRPTRGSTASIPTPKLRSALRTTSWPRLLIRRLRLNAFASDVATTAYLATVGDGLAGRGGLLWAASHALTPHQIIYVSCSNYLFVYAISARYRVRM
jgi:hypothetical protein